MTDRAMYAIRYHDYGGPGMLVQEQVPLPQVQPNSVLVKVKSAGVNPWDWKLRQGRMRQFVPVQFPYTPGIEFSGIVEQVGPGVTGLVKGQAVYGGGEATNAEYAVIPANMVAPKPAVLSFDQAATVPVGAQTAWRALDKTDVKAGQRVLVLGAAGGVGSFIVQLARVHGAHVIGTASARNIDYVLGLGAESVVDYQTTPVETVGHDVDLVFDTVGGENSKQGLHTLRPGGILVAIAMPPPQEEVQRRRVQVESVGQPDRDHYGEQLREITGLIESGKVKVEVTNVFPLADAAKAHALGETGHGRGRIVLHIAD